PVQVAVPGTEPQRIFALPLPDIEPVEARPVIRERSAAQLAVELASRELVPVAVARARFAAHLPEAAVVDVIEDRPAVVHQIADGAEAVFEVPGGAAGIDAREQRIHSVPVEASRCQRAADVEVGTGVAAQVVSEARHRRRARAVAVCIVTLLDAVAEHIVLERYALINAAAGCRLVLGLDELIRFVVAEEPRL